MLANATKRPSAEIEGRRWRRSPCAPPESTLTRVVVPVWRSRTKTSATPFVSPGDEVRRDARERDEAAVGRDRRVRGWLPFASRPARGDAHALGRRRSGGRARRRRGRRSCRRRRGSTRRSRTRRSGRRPRSRHSKLPPFAGAPPECRRSRARSSRSARSRTKTSCDSRSCRPGRGSWRSSRTRRSGRRRRSRDSELSPFALRAARGRRSRARSCRSGGRGRRRPGSRSCRPRRGSWRCSGRRRSGRRRRSRATCCSPFPCAPPESTLTRSVVPVRRSRTKTSHDAVRVAGDEVRGGARRTRRSGRRRRSRGRRCRRSPCAPPESTLTRSVVPRWRSRTKTSTVAVRVAGDEVGRVAREGDEAAVGRRSRERSCRRSPAPRPSRRSRARSCRSGGRARRRPSNPFVSPGDEVRGGAAERHVAAVGGDRGRRQLSPFPCAPPESTLTRSVVPVWRSRTKTSALAVRVAGDEVRGVARERHVPAVRGDRRIRSCRRSPAPRRVDADALGRPASGGRGRRRPGPVRVARDEVRSPRSRRRRAFRRPRSTRRC